MIIFLSQIWLGWEKQSSLLFILRIYTRAWSFHDREISVDLLYSCRGERLSWKQSIQDKIGHVYSLYSKERKNTLSQILINQVHQKEAYLPHIFFPVYSNIHFIDSSLGNGPSWNQQAYSWKAKKKSNVTRTLSPRKLLNTTDPREREGNFVTM